MANFTRREFLKQSVGGAAALGLVDSPLFAQSASRTPQMSIVRWNGPSPANAAEIDRIAEKLTEKVVEAIGGMKRFVSRGDVVWIKPNLGFNRSPELAATCNPHVVATLVRLCFEAGAKRVKVGDNPVNPARFTYSSSGVAAAAKAAGAEVVYLDDSRFREVDVKGERVRLLPVYPEMLECDLLLNVAIAKHHRLAGATLCMKNYMGVTKSPQRRSFHQDIPMCVTDLVRFMKPRISILDGIRVLVDHGPSGGNPADVRVKLTMAASVDVVAIEAFGAELLGRKPTDIGTIVRGQAAGLGTMDYRSLQLKELTIA